MLTSKEIDTASGAVQAYLELDPGPHKMFENILKELPPVKHSPEFRLELAKAVRTAIRTACYEVGRRADRLNGR